MDWLLVPAGALLIFTGVVDVFFTVLHYDGFGFLSSRLYNSLYDSVRFVPTLIAGLENVVAHLDDRFLSEDLEVAPDPVPYETFQAALERGKDPARLLARLRLP